MALPHTPLCHHALERGIAADREKNLAERMQRDCGRTYLMERRREFCLSWNRPLHLVSRRDARPVRRKFSETGELHLQSRRQTSAAAPRAERSDLPVEFARRIS